MIKFSIKIVIIITLFLCLPSIGKAEFYDNVITTKHNFGLSTRDVCIVCHSADAKVTDALGAKGSRALLENASQPIWNKTLDQKIFNVEDITQEFGSSINCINCHDEVKKDTSHMTGVNYPRLPNGNFNAKSPLLKYQRYWAIPDKAGDEIRLPSKNTSQHLTIPLDADPTDPEVAARLVRTTNGKVECDSCHDPHTNTYPPFLRADPTKLCLTCHDR